MLQIMADNVCDSLFGSFYPILWLIELLYSDKIDLL